MAGSKFPSRSAQKKAAKLDDQARGLAYYKDLHTAAPKASQTPPWNMPVATDKPTVGADGHTIEPILEDLKASATVANLTATPVVKRSRASPFVATPKLMLMPTSKVDTINVQIPLLEPKLVKAPLLTYNPWAKKMQSPQRLVSRTGSKSAEPPQKEKDKTLYEDVSREAEKLVDQSATVQKTRNEWTEVQHKKTNTKRASRSLKPNITRQIVDKPQTTVYTLLDRSVVLSPTAPSPVAEQKSELKNKVIGRQTQEKIGKSTKQK